MRVAIIGAGFTGLTAAYELLKAGHQVVIFEKENFAGGLASGMRQAIDDYPFDWEWDLERFYHHWFTNDDAILSLVSKLGKQDKLITRRTLTASWLQGRTWQLDSALSLLLFSPLPLFSRLRMGLVLAYLRYVVKPKQVKKFENVTADIWLGQKMGNEGYGTVWEPLLKGKFADHYQEVNMAWFWARVHKRTPSLMYYQGGFGQLVGDLIVAIKAHGGEIKFNQQLKALPSGFDKTIVTVPPSIFVKLAPSLPEDYQLKLKALRGIGAIVLVLILDRQLLEKVYWLNINEPDWPFLAVVEHTNFIPPKYYGGKHIVYVGNYLDPHHPDMLASKEELLEKFRPYLTKINQQFNNLTIQRAWLFKENYAQPIVGLNHSQKILPLETPIPGVYLASMSQVYPWDRGTNYAVQMGKRVAKEISN